MICHALQFAQLISLSCQTEASSHPWIDTLFFCVCAMLPPHQHMALNVEHVVSTGELNPSTLSGLGDYTSVVASQQTAGKSA
jgi:hypothetical protein